MALAATSLVACASDQNRFQELLNKLEFDEDEVGCVSMYTQLDLNPVPLINSNTGVYYAKEKNTIVLNPDEEPIVVENTVTCPMVSG